MSNDTRGPAPPALKRFIWDIQSMVELDASEREILLIGGDLMGRLLASDDCLPSAFAEVSPDGPQQFQLYADQQERFAVLCTVLSGGQALPIYQNPVWEIMGVLRGAVMRQRFTRADGSPPQEKGEARVLRPGAVDGVSIRSGDAVRLANALAASPSIAIHVYGGEIGRLERTVLAPDGSVSQVVTGYANGEQVPPYDIYTIQTEIKD